MITKPSLHSLESQVMHQFVDNYNSTNNKDLYEAFILDALLYSKNCHFIAQFNDFLIWDYIDEFLKREYTLKESLERLPKFSEFYKNYLTFFCTPTFCDFYFNMIIQDHSENKAEIYYNQHFINKGSKRNKDENENDKNLNTIDGCNINNISEDNIGMNNYNFKNRRNKTKNNILFDSINKRKIEHNTIMSSTNFLFNKNEKQNESNNKNEGTITLLINNNSMNNNNINSNNSVISKYSNQQTITSIINEIILKPKKRVINTKNGNDKDKRDKNKHRKGSLKIKPKHERNNNNNNINNNNNKQHVHHNSSSALTVSNSSTRKIISQTVQSIRDNNEPQLNPISPINNNNNIMQSKIKNSSQSNVHNISNNNNNNNTINNNNNNHYQSRSRNIPSQTQTFLSFNTLTKSQTQRDHFKSSHNIITSSTSNLLKKTSYKTNTIDAILRQIAYKRFHSKKLTKSKQSHNTNKKTSYNSNSNNNYKPRSTLKTKSKTNNLFSIDTFLSRGFVGKHHHINYNTHNHNHIHPPLYKTKNKDLIRYKPLNKQSSCKNTSIKKSQGNINNNNDANIMKLAFSLLLNNQNTHTHSNHTNSSNCQSHRSNSHHKHTHSHNKAKSNNHNNNNNNNNNTNNKAPFKNGSNGLTSSNKNIHNININISNHINITNNSNKHSRNQHRNNCDIGCTGSGSGNGVIFSSFPGQNVKGIKLNGGNSCGSSGNNAQKGKGNMFQTTNLFKSFSKLKIKAYADKANGNKNSNGKKIGVGSFKKVKSKNSNGGYCTLNFEGKKKYK